MNRKKSNPKKKNNRQTLFIAEVLPGMNEMIADINLQGFRMSHKAKRNATPYQNKKRLLEQYIKNACRAQKIKPVKGRVAVHVVFYEPNRRRDPDNVQAAIKVILDGLQHAGILEGDGHKHIKGPYQYPVEIRKDNPGVEVRLVEED